MSSSPEMSSSSSEAGSSSSETIGATDEWADDTDYDKYESWKEALQEHLNGIKSFGNIAAFKRYTTYTNLGLKIEGHPAFPLPLTPEHAESIKGACRQAPFGKGEETLVDTSVRNTWELGHDQFELLNSEWPAFLEKVGAESARGLGLKNIALKPHKLLLYEKGSFFKRHRDTEKERGMVGTLVVCLPSEHMGGDVHVSLGSEKLRYSTAPTSRSDLTALAWYSDVSHEIRKLEAGYRLALTYNIVQDDSERQSAGFHCRQARHIRKVLTEWKAMFPHVGSLIYTLDHKYSEASLSIHNMKGRDRAVCRDLQEVVSECGVYLFFAHLDHLDEYALHDGDHRYSLTELSTLYSLDGTPISRRKRPSDEEILDMDKIREGDPDGEDEEEYTGNEGDSKTLRYYRTVAVLVKKNSLSQYVCLYDGPSEDLYRHNMIRMVADEMERVMKGQATNAISGPSFLDVLRNALGRKGHSKTFTPVAVSWALKLEDIAFYKSTMVAAAKSGVQDICDGALQTACGFVEQRFGDGPESIDWDKWVGSVAEPDTVSGVRDIIRSFTPVFSNDAVRDSFVKWGESKLSKKLHDQAVFDVDDHLFFIETIAEKHENKDWLVSSLTPSLGCRGIRELIYRVLHSAFAKKDQVDFPIAKELFDHVLRHGFTKLLLEGVDLLPEPPKPPSTTYPGYLSITRNPPTPASPCSGPLMDFVAIVDHCLNLGLIERGRELVEECCNQLVRTKAEWDFKKVHGAVVWLLLTLIFDTLKKHDFLHIEGVKCLFEVILREGLHANVLRNLPAFLGWAHKPLCCVFGFRPEGNMYFEKYYTSSGYEKDFNVYTEETLGEHTLVVEKTGREHEEALMSWQHSVWTLDSQLRPLRTEMVAGLLGDEAYRKLVIAEELMAQFAASGGRVPSGTKRALDEAATAERPGVKRARM
ncbi:2OG-Fe(II) oxygenase [Colletotrichum zoysiae]|uniref:2OG-Fe(II) oxygenase n=1 Tax=Colletotrichum zoysiae TaxID=1216348 RepID=A0AAD9H9M3_9PEZI|nr:2OG-Fe(II) oxygenase [Colletotrichum zoysiae]